MEPIRWRYHPEFQIIITVNSLPVRSGIRITPSLVSAQTNENYGAIFRPSDGSLVCFVRQHHNGANWVPAIPLTDPVTFSFLLEFTGDIPISNFPFYAQGTSTFGRRIFYANNLSVTGAIDSNLVANAVRLTPGNDVALSDSGSLSAGIVNKQFTAGAFTQLRVGKIKSGIPTTFSINQPITVTQSHAGIDLSLFPKGSYVVRFEGGAPIEEKVFVDPASEVNHANGIVEIFRTTWHTPPLPRIYRINFTSL